MKLIKINFVVTVCLVLQLSAQSLPVDSLVARVSQENIIAHVDSLCWAGGHETRSSFTEGNHVSVLYIYNYLNSLPGLKVQLDTFYIEEASGSFSSVPQFNVVAYKTGSIDSSEILLVGGHYDASGSHSHLYNDYWNNGYKARGADDNATGVAATLEIARILSDPELSFRNDLSLKFIAFGAEEYHPVHPDVHHAGSIHDAQKMSDQNIPLKGAIILDMIGYNNSYNYVEVIADHQSNWLAGEVFDYRDQFVPDLYTNSSPIDVPYSDHDSYQKYGFPAILLMENDKPWNDDNPWYKENPYYHSSADSAGTVNFELVTKVTQVALATTAGLSQAASATEADDKFAMNSRPAEFIVRAYPNPFNGRVNLQFTLKKNTKMTIDIFNALGQRVETLQKGQIFRAGSHLIQWTADKQSSGVYFCIFKSDNAVHSEKLIYLK